MAEHPPASNLQPPLGFPYCVTVLVSNLETFKVSSNQLTNS